jgi:hypothetical protein
MVLAQNRHEDYWNTIEDPAMNPFSYDHLIFTKALKIYHGEKTASSTNVAGKVAICSQKTESRSMAITLY